MLEQTVRRYETLSRQVPAIAATAIEEARSAATRSSSRLAKTLDHKQQLQVSELKSNISADNSSKLNQLSSELDQTRYELNRVVSDMKSPSADVSPTSGETATARIDAAPVEEPAPVVKKRAPNEPDGRKIAMFHTAPEQSAKPLPPALQPALPDCVKPSMCSGSVIGGLLPRVGSAHDVTLTEGYDSASGGRLP